MIQVPISATDVEVLQEARYTHPYPRVQRKLHALYLMGLGLPRHVVARMVGVFEGTVRNDLQAYEQGASRRSVRVIPILRPPHSMRMRTRFAKPLSPSLRIPCKKRSSVSKR